jgi:hypothetical protein
VITSIFQKKSHGAVAGGLRRAIDPTATTVESRLSCCLSLIKIHDCRTLISLTVLLVIALAAGTPCRAQEYSAGDWISMPAGTNVLMGYYDFAGRSQFNNTTTGDVPHSHLNSDIGIARFMHFDKFLGHTVAIQGILPFGSLNDAKIGGQKLSNASGVGDPIIAGGMWLLNDTKHNRYFSFVNFVSVPIGSYDKHSPLNLGSHRWQDALEWDYTQIFAKKIMVDLAVSDLHAWDNHEAGTGNQTLQQNETISTYSWIGYNVTSLIKRPENLPAWLSVGYSGNYNGVQRLNGVRTGAAAGAQTIKMGYSQFITPKWQGLVQVSHDLDTRGQFKQKVGVFVRIARVF